METERSRPPIRSRTSTNPERRLPLRDEHEEQERRKDHEMDEAVENVGPPGTEGEKARDSREHEQHGVLTIKPSTRSFWSVRLTATIVGVVRLMVASDEPRARLRLFCS
jgi:hypothetical protein